jgi:hypothetical protein
LTAICLALLAAIVLAATLPAAGEAEEPTGLGGTVTAEGGGGLEGAEVCVYVYGSPTLGALVECKQTGAGGTYEFIGLAPGEYGIEFIPPAPGEYFSQYFSGATTEGAATPVVVAAETVIPNINAALVRKPPPGPGKIAGKVTAEDTGLPIGNVTVCAAKVGGVGSACEITASSGEYEIGALTAGEYTVEFTPPAPAEFFPQFYSGASSVGGATHVLVAAETTTPNIDAALVRRPPTKITGTVSAEGGGLFANVEVCVYVYGSPTLGALVECKLTGSSGTYEFVGLAAGQYTVEFNPPAPAKYLTQFYAGAGSAVQATPVTVAAETTTPNINATLVKKPPSGPARISGTVTAEGGGPAEGVKVCIKQVGAVQPLCELTASNGGYTFGGLATGEWGITFNAQGTGKNLLSLAYPNKEIWETPTPITLTPGAEETIDVALRIGGQISGTVRLAATGAPVAGVRVCLTESAEFAALACLTTPSTGRYSFIAVWPGSFKVVFSAAAADFPDASPIGDPYSTQWWSGQPTYGTAVPIAVAPPTPITGVDASLAPIPAVTPSAPSSTTTTTPAATTTSTTVAPPLVVIVAAAKTASKKLKCRTGFTKRKVKGKPRCVKLQKHRKKGNHRKAKKSA